MLALFFLQVSPGVNPDWSTRLQSAMSYRRFDAVIWVPVFAVGVALGWAFARNRRGADPGPHDRVGSTIICDPSGSSIPLQEGRGRAAAHGACPGLTVAISRAIDGHQWQRP